MKLKNILITSLSAAMATFALSSCVNDEYVEPNSFSDVSWHMNEDSGNVNPICLAKGKYLSLMDLSQGLISHEWIVSENGTYFLTGDMGYGITDYTPYIDESIPHTNGEDNLNIYFTEPGDHTVRLRNVFDHAVSYSYRPDSYLRPNYVETYYSTEIGNGEHLIDTTFTIDVYDTDMVPMATAYYDAAMTQPITMGCDEYGANLPVTIEYGQTIYFADCSTDRPNTWSWNCYSAGLSASDSLASMTFRQYTSNNPFTVSLGISRATDVDNKYIPTTGTTTATLPLNIWVVASEDPIAIDSVYLSDYRRIQVVMGNGMFDVASLADVQNAFTVSVYNDYDDSVEPYSNTFTSSAVSLESGSDYILNIDFADDLYNTDQITMTYNGSAILSSDGRVMETMNNVNVVTNLADCFPTEYFDFNLGDQAWLDEWWYVRIGTGTASIELVEDPDPECAGNQVLKFVSETATNGLGHNYLFSAPSGSYSFKAKIYCVDGDVTSTTSGISFYITTTSTYNDTTFSNSTAAGWYSLHATAGTKDGWYQLEASFVSGGGTDVSFSIWNNGLVGTYYLKDIELINEQLRPDETVNE